MTLKLIGVMALALLVGCLRYGYGARPAATDHTPDAAHGDAGSTKRHDAAVADAASRQDANVFDAHMSDGSTPDAAHGGAEAGALDAAAALDARVPYDGATQASMDSGPKDSGASDTGPTDSGSSSTRPCAFTVTTNEYAAKPHYHGTLALKNTGVTTWTTPIIEFDLPASTYVCNDANILPGAGWNLQSSAGHCAYTRTSPSLAIAPGAMLNFEYSSNYSRTPPGSAANNLSVAGCP